MRITSFATAGMLVLASGVFAAGQTWTGKISDQMCGADHRAMAGKLSDRDCTLECAKGGTPFVLVVDGKTYVLKGDEADLRTHAGHTVKVTGELKNGTIDVSKVEMPKAQK